MKNKTQKRTTTGAFIAINPDSGYVANVLIAAADDQQQRVIEGTLARLTKPSQWAWLRHLFRFST